MLKFYLTSVLIFAIIMFCSILLVSKNLKENGWIDETKKGSVFLAILYLFAMSAIPIIRVIIIAGLFMMTTCTKEEYTKIHNNRKDDE